LFRKLNSLFDHQKIQRHLFFIVFIKVFYEAATSIEDRDVDNQNLEQNIVYVSLRVGVNVPSAAGGRKTSAADENENLYFV